MSFIQIKLGGDLLDVDYRICGNKPYHHIEIDDILIDKTSVYDVIEALNSVSKIENLIIKELTNEL